LTGSEATPLVAETAARCRRAAARVRPYVRNTELLTCATFDETVSAEVYFKMENRQHSGSFKIRGAFNRLLSLTPQQRSAGCVTASSGNHGAAVACALQSLAIDGVIFVPKHTSSVKVEAIRSYGGDVRFFGDDGLETETYARDFAVREGLFYVSPYNDHEVIAGQGTCGIEIEAVLPDLDAAFIAVGGGGLASGVGSVLKAHNPDIKIYGCQPQASAVMAHSVAAGRIVDMVSDTTLSDGTAGGIEQDSVTFPIIRDVVDEFVVVSEAEIAAAMRMFMRSVDESIEGAAGVAVAAMLQQRPVLADRKIAVIICGGNISDEDLARVKSGAV
jgi:threonine dehydratase